MSFLIDGYNFLFQMKEQKGTSLEKRRETFITSLDQELACFKPSISLIFDSQEQDRNYAQCAHLCHIDIFYAPKGKTADEYIIELVEIAHNPKIITVVTSDGGLALQCNQMGARTLSIGEFVSVIIKKGRTPCEEKPCFRESSSEMERLLREFEKRLGNDGEG